MQGRVCASRRNPRVNIYALIAHPLPEVEWDDVIFYLVSTLTGFQWYVIYEPKKASGKVSKLFKCHSLPGKCRRELLSQKQCLCSVIKLADLSKWLTCSLVPD